MPMRNPPHPGLSVRVNCLEPLGLSVTEGAKALGIRFEKMGWSNADHWMRLQASYDLAQARLRADDIKVQRYNKPRRAA